MILDISNEKLEKVIIQPANELVEIAQNVKTILTTARGTAWLDRGFGVSDEVIDRPENAVRAILTAEIADAVSKFEPRAKVTDCFYKADETGKVIVTARIKIVEKNLRSKNEFKKLT